MIYGNDAARFDPLPAPEVPRGEVIDEFYAAAISGKTPLHGGAWSRATMEVCLAMQESACNGQEDFPDASGRDKFALSSRPIFVMPALVAGIPLR